MRVPARTAAVLLAALLVLSLPTVGELKFAPTRANASPATLAQREPPVPKEMLDRVSAWVETFVAGFNSLAAEETLLQTEWNRKGQPSARRQIVSDYLVLRLPPSGQLREFRDLIRVDDRAIQGFEERQAKWPRLAAASTADEFGRLLQDPAKHRLVGLQFANLPLLVTRFAERHREKMKFFFAQDTADEPSDYTLVGYRQLSGEGLMVVDDRAVMPSGRAWVDADDGHIARIIEEFRYKNDQYRVEIEFGWNDSLAKWLPTNMIVRTIEKGRLKLQNAYSYSGYRRLATADRAEATPTPANPKPRE